MDSQNKYDELLKNEEELFRRFLENGSAYGDRQRDGDSNAVCVKEITHEETYTRTYDEFYDDTDEYTDTQKINDTDIIRSVKDFLPDMSPLFGQNGKNLSLQKKVFLFFSLLAKKENAKRMSCILIPAFLVLFLIFNILTPSKAMSEKENRTLASVPELSKDKILDGSFMKEFETYISDQFVMRNGFVSLKRECELLSGKEENHGILICDDGYLIENSQNYTYENVMTNIGGINSLSAVSRYNVKVAVVPTAYEIMKDKLPGYSYTDTYSKLQGTLKANIKNASVTDTAKGLDAHKDEYIYYRTDHHQTALGSYYLYSELSESLGYMPYALEDFAVEIVNEEFLGTTWSNSGFADTKKDIIYKYTLNKPYKFSVSFPEEGKSIDSLYSEKMLDTKDKYSYYLDGNHGLCVVSSSVDSGKKLAIIKDSYAHSLIPFLANHYSQIHLIDLRYYKGDIFEYLYTNNIKDCLFLYNQNTFMTDSNLSKISEYAKTSPYTSVPDINYGVVPKTERADVSYFDDAVFVGDSLTIGIQNFSLFNSTFLCMGGLNTKNLETDSLPNGKTTVQSIKDMSRIGKLYIMLGTNEVAFDEMEEYLERYSLFIDTVRKRFPDVIVYIQSIMPVTKHTSETTGIKNDKIVLYNKELLKMATEKQCYYIDLHSYFSGEDGALPDNIGSDGIHLGPEKYKELSVYLQDHAVPSEGVNKISDSLNTGFAKGGKGNADAIAKSTLSTVNFEDELTKVSDTLLISNYKVDMSKLYSASMYLGGGVTAEEVAVFEAISEAEAKNIEKLAEERIERKKLDYEDYIPAEMTKLNAPYIVRKGNTVIVCIANSADSDELKNLIK